MFFWPHLPSPEFRVHEGATRHMEHANNLGNLETGTLISGPCGIKQLLLSEQFACTVNQGKASLSNAP